MPHSIVHLGDCLEAMRQMPDKAYDLAITDPEYGIGADYEMGLGDPRRGNRKVSKWGGKKQWDSKRPSQEYFFELQRVSRNQIICGGNYFADLLPPSRCWIIWDKMQRIDQADAELLWTSFKGSCRVFEFHASKLMGFQNPDRFHPTEKPIELYSWLLQKYAKQGQKLLDTHRGSDSFRIAAYIGGFDFTGYEIDEDFHNAACKRFEEFKKSFDSAELEPVNAKGQIKLF